jgi:hypothetical protein
MEYDRYTSPVELTDISRHVSPCFATRCLCWYLSESSGALIRNDWTQMRAYNISENSLSAWDALYDTPVIETSNQ